MDYMTELTAIAKTHGGIIETKIAAQRGISKAMLYKLCKEDKIHRIVKGQYILPDDMQDELLAISNRMLKWSTVRNSVKVKSCFVRKNDSFWTVTDCQ